jgi:predicted alpha-1,2-mannosidase
MMAMAEQNGWYPRWPLGIGETLGMLGEPAAIVIADTWIKGVRDFDLEHAYELFDATAYGDPAGGGGRSGMEPYLRLGWVSIENGGSAASRTLEFAYADDALATMAHELGRADEEAALRARGRNYANLWDPAQELLVGRREDGSFGTVRPTVWDDVYAEGNAWQYLWLAPHDLEGLAETLGGRDRLLERLAYFFDQSARERRTGLPPAWYWHGNEPDLHAPWIFGALGDADATARWAAWAREVHYDDTPLGLPGNDDGGTMSAWYLFAALGFYPLAGESYYVIGSPRVTRAVVHLPAGDLVIEAPEAANGVVYVQRLTLDGEEIPRDRIEHARLATGGTLRFELGAEPAR